MFKLDHAKEILIIISDVFGDIDGDLQYDSEKYLTDPDIYYSNYLSSTMLMMMLKMHSWAVSVALSLNSKFGDACDQNT